MPEKFRIFLLLLRKSFLIRKRRWIQLLLLQIIIPIGLVLMSQSIARGSSSINIENFPNDTYYRIESEESLMSYVPWDLVLKYTPSNTITDKIMEDTKNCLGQSVNVSASLDEITMINEFLHQAKEEMFNDGNIGIVFQTIPNNVTLPKQFKYKLRIAAPEPIELFDPEENSGWGKYRYRHASTVQVPLCLDKAYINQVVPKPEYKTKISIQQRPYPPYEQVNQYSANSVTPFSIISTLIFPIILCVEAVLPANEKFIGINVLMALNGISNRMNLFSWFVSGAIWSTTYLLPTVVILKYYGVPYAPPFLIHGDAFLVWLSLFIHTCHLLAFGLHLSAYFWKPFRGIIGTIIMIIITNVLNSTLTGRTAQHLFMYLGILSPNFLLRRMISEISTDEDMKGLSWSNLFISASDTIPEGSIGVMMVFSVIGIFFHFFMAVYIYAIRPGKYGVPRHPLFCIRGKKNDEENHGKHMMNVDSKESSMKEFEYVEPGSLEPGIQIRGLKKVYVTDLFRQTKIDVLRNVSIDIYKRQITALLGHNGAGKTTMMSILSGLTDATAGAAFIDGKNILNETNSINNNISLCPQENILFSDMTVHQQLMFFGMMKANNRTRLHLENEVRMLLNKVSLAEKENNYPAQLSGGQKRRLCLALAIIVDAKVLILDEPTSGMDAESKREVWNILLKMRGEKTILISTHDMEEADILGDRIAIMHTGKLRSYGTSMFLKKLYGHGQVEVTLSVEPWCEITKISKEIGVTAQILNQNDGKIVLALPPSESLPEALDKLENSKKQLGITGMSVSIITLEQVFVRVTKDKGDERDSHENVEIFEKVTGFSYYLQTLSAYFIKKLKYARRNPWNFLISVFLLCISTLPVLLLSDPSIQQNPYALSLSVYPDTRAFVHSDTPPWSAMYLRTIKDFGSIATEVNSTASITNVLLNYAKHDKASYQNKIIVSAEFNNTPSGDVLANGFYSGTAVLGMPITINCITNTIVKALTNDEEYKIEMAAQRVPYGQALRKEEAQVNSLLVTITFVLFLSQVIALYVIQPLNEILSGIKQLQMMTGAPKLTYWAANFSFDYAQYIISILFMLIVLIIIDVSSDIQLYYGTEICIALMLLLLFGLSVFPFLYVSTFLKRTINMTTIILTLVPIMLVIIDFILQFMVSTTDKEAYRIFRLIQSKIFLFVPHVSFAYGHYAFFTIAVENAHCRRTANALPGIYNCTNSTSYFTPIEGFLDLKGSLLWLGSLSIFYFGIIFILEQEYLERIIMKIRGNKSNSHSESLDEIVKEEKKIVAQEIAKRINGPNPSDHDNGNIFLVQELNKNYGSLHAVKEISFRVKESECFGLLGVNGAGKSTTFKMLTGDILPSGGTVYLKQYNISSDRSNYLSSMGYCPQQDAIITTLNSWDHLYLFARLRGIPSSQVPTTVKQWIKKLNLTPCAVQPSGTYSGGNKRRLNIALALIGNPPLVLMDEPTTGVDPAARRSLWNTLKMCKNAGQSIILTSHSMEECEALCSRLVIMVGGQIVCVGASEQLKQRFGAGYNIHIKLSSTQRISDVEAIKQRIISTLKCTLTDQNTGFLGYHVIDPNATWTIMYTLMDELKNDYNCIEDYVVLSSTLEQLFIQFARSPENPINDHDTSHGLSSV